ncbi:MAG: hypothetical protein HYZ26_10765 [Chloroflexi bacterium]|nr:hypothetical protein [Chloroflexota bacterium]
MSHPLIEEGNLNQVWEEIEVAFGGAGFVQPAPGFSARFRLRLNARRAAEERRRGFLVAVLWIGVALLAAAVLAWLFAPVLANPVDLFSRAIQKGWNVLTYLGTLLAIVSSVYQFLPDLVSPSLVYSLLAVLAAAASWAYSTLRDYAFVRGVRL